MAGTVAGFTTEEIELIPGFGMKMKESVYNISLHVYKEVPSKFKGKPTYQRGFWFSKCMWRDFIRLFNAIDSEVKRISEEGGEYSFDIGSVQ